jgi:hypothetical protein
MSDEAERAPNFLKKQSEVVRHAKKRIIELSQQSPNRFSGLAEELFTIHAGEGREGLRAAAKQAQISLRKAYQLVKMRNVLDNHWDANRIERIGWTKLCNVTAATAGKSGPVEQWLKFAETHTARQCQLHLEKMPFKNETRCMLLRFDDNQYQAFSRALLKLGAKQRGKGLVGVERALMSAVRKMRQASLL